MRQPNLDRVLGSKPVQLRQCKPGRRRRERSSSETSASAWMRALEACRLAFAPLSGRQLLAWVYGFLRGRSVSRLTPDHSVGSGRSTDGPDEIGVARGPPKDDFARDGQADLGNVES